MLCRCVAKTEAVSTMKRITMVMCLIGLCTSISALDEHEQIEHAGNPENTDEGNGGDAQVPMGVTEDNRGGIGGIETFYKNPSLSKLLAQAIQEVYVPHHQRTSPTEPDAPQEQFSPYQYPYNPYYSFYGQQRRRSSLYLLLPFIIARLRTSTTTTSPLVAPTDEWE
ncbi:hypothetical protein AGOR_G00191360 [Albula goreensis]|uniref:Secreted protein n=1 Tax=Albula goreensis TaxID=1534307 RepID=A0A8T3CUX9_9TELE|nr:hypothetical protein AGOR_G00191360 [Albula goreensis]